MAGELISDYPSNDRTRGGRHQDRQSNDAEPSGSLTSFAFGQRPSPYRLPPHMSRRPLSASASVVPSTYSRSLPMGMPRAGRVTRAPNVRINDSR